MDPRTVTSPPASTTAAADEREGRKRRTLRPGAGWILIVALLYGVMAFAGIAHGASGVALALGLVLVSSAIASPTLGPPAEPRGAGPRRPD